MRILVILAHPKRDSFNAALQKAVCEGLRAAGHLTDVIDLYAEGFDPVMRGAELDALGTGRPPADTAAYQRRILQSQGLVLVFPVWWFGIPAILKGFIDRVFEEGFAFRFESDGSVRGLLTLKKALVLSTTGAGASPYRRFGFARPLKDAFDEWTLKLCGLRTVRHIFFYGAPTIQPAARAEYLRKAKKLGLTFFG